MAEYGLRPTVNVEAVLRRRPESHAPDQKTPAAARYCIPRPDDGTSLIRKSDYMRLYRTMVGPAVHADSPRPARELRAGNANPALYFCYPVELICCLQFFNLWDEE
ncbi:hypothetical protein [Burkholderia stagnalis]|uniref:hypothetical protein n=1 Tax=Burkholderia stagnalis TaxID=1503054 RepID=UPI000F56E95B|nr:hypothetical protein [Burkholderia stagnalis]